MRNIWATGGPDVKGAAKMPSYARNAQPSAMMVPLSLTF